MWWPSRDLFIPQTLGWSPWQPLKKGPWTHHPKKRSWLKSQGYFKIQSNNSTKYSSILNNPLRFVHLTHMLSFTRQMFQNLKKHASLPVWWHSVWFLPSYRRKGPSKQRLNKNMTQIPFLNLWNYGVLHPFHGGIVPMLIIIPPTKTPSIVLDLNQLKIFLDPDPKRFEEIQVPLYSHNFSRSLLRV